MKEFIRNHLRKPLEWGMFLMSMQTAQDAVTLADSKIVTPKNFLPQEIQVNSGSSQEFTASGDLPPLPDNCFVLDYTLPNLSAKSPGIRRG